MKRRKFLQSAGLISVSPLVASATSSSISLTDSPFRSARKLWLNYLEKLAEPVLTALASDQLKQKMPVEAAKPELAATRARFTHLEAFGRLLNGIAPWLQADLTDQEEKNLQEKYFQLALQGIGNAVNPTVKDYMNWGDEGGQPLVDASFFAYALIRCPKLWQNLKADVQKQVITCLQKTRKISPPPSNWLLFAGMIEAFFITVNESFDIVRIDYAVRQHLQWYKGDGMYGDGSEFHWDYYNSFVIHPYLYDILKIIATNDTSFESIRKQVLEHSLRYAIIQERLIAADGSYPVIGRSITYRTGAFHHLANMVLNKQLPAQLKPAQVRCALTAVIDKVTEHKDLFDNNGWLQIGLYGHQPSLAEYYISTGSLYLCSAILLPLGLPESDPFWADADEDWTSKKIVKGIDTLADHSM